MADVEVPAIKPAARLLLEALDVLGRRSRSGGLGFLGACAEAEGNRYEGNKSNVFHSFWVFFSPEWRKAYV